MAVAVDVAVAVAVTVAGAGAVAVAMAGLTTKNSPMKKEFLISVCVCYSPTSAAVGVIWN